MKHRGGVSHELSREQVILFVHKISTPKIKGGTCEYIPARALSQHLVPRLFDHDCTYVITIFAYGLWL